MAHTYKTDPDYVKEARGADRRHTHLGSAYTKHRRDLSKRIRARERREMDRILRDMEAWGDYTPTGNSIIREFDSETNAHAWFGY